PVPRRSTSNVPRTGESGVEDSEFLDSEGAKEGTGGSGILGGGRGCGYPSGASTTFPGGGGSGHEGGGGGSG
ncbi:hypothetical protein SERLA73DRAFT_183225, partial [Serpula lacrymans var. lacrymans S7.3]